MILMRAIELFPSDDVSIAFIRKHLEGEDGMVSEDVYGCLYGMIRYGLLKKKFIESDMGKMHVFVSFTPLGAEMYRHSKSAYLDFSEESND